MASALGVTIGATNEVRREKSMRPTFVVAKALLLLVACSRSQGPSTARPADAAAAVADTVYVNGKIYTVNDEQPWVEAVAIKDGKFLVVGSNADVEAVTGDRTEVVDVGGRFVMPGIVDLHVHPFTTPVYGPMYLSFSEPTNPDRMMAELKAYADEHPDAPVIRGGQWGVGVYPDNNPSKEILDEIVAERPVALLDQTGHTLWLNSKGLKLAGITAETPSDPTSVVEKDPESGEPTGVVREAAIRMVERAFPRPGLDEYAQAIQEVFSEFNSLGVTSMQTAEGHEHALNATKLLEDAEKLTMRLFVGWDWHLAQITPYSNEEMDAQIAARGKYTSELIAPNFVKIFTDGAPDGYAVPFLEPYADGSGQFGRGKISPEDLREAVIAFDAAGVGVFFHAIGDVSVRAALDAVAAAREVNGNSGVRHKIGHVNWVHPDDFPRFASIPDLSASISPAVTYPSPAFEGYVPLLGQKRVDTMYQARTFLENGAILGWGTDWLTIIPPSPWMPMQGFVTRTNPDRPAKGTLGDGQELTVEEAIRVFTINGAYAVGAEDRIGSIEVGKLADFIVLDRNLLEIEPTRIRDTVVERTVLGGRIVYDRDRDPEPDVLDESDYEGVGRLIH